MTATVTSRGNGYRRVLQYRAFLGMHHRRQPGQLHKPHFTGGFEPNLGTYNGDPTHARESSSVTLSRNCPPPWLLCCHPAIAPVPTLAVVRRGPQRARNVVWSPANNTAKHLSVLLGNSDRDFSNKTDYLRLAATRQWLA